MVKALIPLILFLALLTAALAARDEQGDSNCSLRNVVFSPSMNIIAAGSDGDVFLWDKCSGKLLLRFPSGNVALAPDGRISASGAYGEIFLRDLPSGDVSGRLKGPQAYLNAIAYSPDGSLLAGGFGDGTIWLWNTGSMARYAVYALRKTPVNRVAFSPDGRLLAGCGHYDYPRIWDLAHGRVMALSFPGESKDLLLNVKDVAFSPDSRTVVCIYGKTYDTPNTIVLWDARNGNFLKKFSSGDSSESESIYSIAWSPDGRFLATGFDRGSLYLWDVEKYSVMRIMNLRANHRLSVAFSKDGKVLAAGAKNIVVLIEPESGQVLQTLSPEPNYVYTTDFSHDGESLVAGTVDGALRIWDRKSGELKKILLRHSSWISCFSWLPGGKVMASGSPDGTLRLWEFPSGKHLRALVRRRLPGDDSFFKWLDSIAPLSNGTDIASAYYDGNLIIWDSKTGKVKNRTKVGRLHTLAALPAIKAIAIGSSSLSFLDEEGATLEKSWREQPDPVYVIAVSQEGRLLAAASLCGAIRVWDTLTGELHCAIVKGEWFLNSLDFSPEGRSIAGGGSDNLIHLWDMESGKETTLFKGHSDAVRSVCYSPDGKSLASGSDDGTVRLWDINSGSPVRSFTMSMIKAN